jgi:hypothetical protein
MAQVPTDQEARKKNLNRLWKLFLPLGGVTGALALIAVVYFGYDLVKGNVSPCESIFQQTTVGLSTKIKFLKTEGELKLGPEKVAELSERAQMTALDLKTCCTVLDAGRIDPDQFLQCKAKAQTYDARVEDIAALLRAAMPNANGVASAAPEPTVSAPALNTAFEAARTASQDFNQHVAKVAAEQELKSLKAAPAAQLAVDAAEREPNDDGLNANVIELAKPVKAAIAAAKDGDVFTFTTPATYRDWIHVELTNQSTTLDPNLELFDATKAMVGSTTNTTPGGDLSYDFVAPPSTKFSVRIASHYASNTGVYALSIAPKKAYDAFEPNDDILSAHRIAEATPVKAGIMDKNDVDVFSTEGASGERTMTVTIANGSTTLHPHVVVYDAGKTELGGTQNTTAGGDLSYSFKAPKGPVYIRVSDHYTSDGGAYTLTIAPQ